MLLRDQGNHHLPSFNAILSFEADDATVLLG